MNDRQLTPIEKRSPDFAPRWSFEQDRQHVLSRLEGFTDVIFGFAIFTAAMNLKVPENAKDLVDQRMEFFAFFCNFVFITALWWQQHRIFASYFKPTPLAIMLHFAFLGCTAMLSYPLQLYMQNHKSLVVIQTYLAGFAVVYFLQTMLIFLGRHNLRTELSPERFARGAVFGGISASICVVSLISLALTLFVGSIGGAAMSLIPVAVFGVRRFVRARQAALPVPKPIAPSDGPDLAAYDAQ